MKRFNQTFFVFLVSLFFFNGTAKAEIVPTTHYDSQGRIESIDYFDHYDKYGIIMDTFQWREVYTYLDDKNYTIGIYRHDPVTGDAIVLKSVNYYLIGADGSANAVKEDGYTYFGGYVEGKYVWLGWVVDEYEVSPERFGPWVKSTIYERVEQNDGSYSGRISRIEKFTNGFHSGRDAYNYLSSSSTSISSIDHYGFYDLRARLYSTDHLDKQGRIKNIATYLYNSSGKQFTESTKNISYFSKQKRAESLVEYILKSDGSSTQKTHETYTKLNRDGSLWKQNETFWTYHANGKVATLDQKEENFDNGEFSHTKSYYDQTGKLIKTEVLDKAGNVTETIEKRSVVALTEVEQKQAVLQAANEKSIQGVKLVGDRADANSKTSSLQNK